MYHKLMTTLITLMTLILMPFLAPGQTQPDTKLSVDGVYGTISDQCNVSNAKKHVWIFKQWHLGPAVNTHVPHANPPQMENQRAIYKQLESWVEKKGLDTLYSEGCTGEITDNFSKEFNGWNIKDLSEASQSTDYDNVVTLVPLKMKAKFHDRIKVYCADDEKLIQKQNESLSDARGSLGFLTRIEQLKGDAIHLKPYLDKVIQMDHLPPHSTPDDAIKKLNEDLKSEVAKVEKGLEERNLSFFKALEKAPQESALVVGGLHAKGLEVLLKRAGIDCTVVEPKGYRSEDEKIFNVSELNHK